MEESEKNEERPEVVVQEPQTFLAQTVNIPNEYKPISMWGYFGYELLFSIPCIGFILLCVFSFGGTQNVNLKNFARSYFCFLIIGLVFIAIIFAILAAAGMFAAGASGSSGFSGFDGFGKAAVEDSARAVMP